MTRLRYRIQSLLLAVFGLIGLGIDSAPTLAQTPPDITRFAPDQVVMCLTLLGEARIDEKGAALERWLAQPEIKDSFLNVQDLIRDQIQGTDPNMAGLVEWLPQLVLGQPWILFMDDPDLEKPKLKFVLQLGDFEKKVQEAVHKLERDSEQEIVEFEIAGNPFKRVTNPEGSVIEYGIYKTFLMVAAGQGELEKIVNRLEAGAPKWVAEIKSEMPVERTEGLLLLDIKQLVERNAEAGEEGMMLDVLKLEELEKVVGVMGFEGQETINRMSFHCAPELKGLWSIFEVEPLKQADFRGVSDSVHSLVSFKINPTRLWELCLKSDETRPGLEQFRQTLRDEFEIDLEQDLIENLAGHFYSYQQLTLLNPQSNALVGIEIRDPKSFQKRLGEFLETWEDQTDFFGVDVEETKNGPLYQLVPFEPEMQGLFSSICFQVVGNELLIALDSKAINSHIRKSSRDGGKLTDDPRVARLFETGRDDRLGSPIAVFYLDVQVLIESVYSILPVVLGQIEQMGNGGDFGMEMLPPLEQAVNGVLPNIVAVYRTEKGFQLIDRSTLPGLSASTGLVVALTLPAVAQVRNAARKVTSINNLRQLGIAMLNFESANQALPAAYRTRDGKKLLSWRVAILPFIDQAELYNRFKHDEPWDSPHNQALIKEMPEVFTHPTLKLEPGQTVYLAVTGQRSILVPSEEEKGRSFKDVVDGTSVTAMLVEANRQHAVYWTQPDDFNVDEIEDLAGALRGNWQGGGFHVIMGDCRVRDLTVSSEILKRMATVDGGESSDGWFDD